MGKKREGYLSFLKYASIAGIAIGVTSLMLVIGVMNGFTEDLKKKIIGANPTITIEGKPFITDYKKIIRIVKSNIKEIEGISPYITSQVIYKSSHYIIGGLLKGIVPQTESSVTNLPLYFKNGNIYSVEEGIVLGSELAKELDVKVGDKIWVIGGLIPREKVFKVTGIIECGVYSYDVSIGVTSLDNIQEFFNIGDIVHGIGIRTEDIYNSEQIAGKIRELLNYKYEVSTWIQKNKILFAALALEKKAMGIILLLIILVASFNIASTLMITVFRKTKEIGILKAMGVSSKEIKKIFIYEGLILGIEGLAFGLLIGGILAFSLKKYHFIKLPEMVYNLSTLPIQITFKDIIFMCIAVLFIVIISTFYPAHRAGKLNPAEALRYE